MQREIVPSDGTGWARNTASAQSFLNSCPAVREWRELTPDVIEFQFDMNIEVSVVPPGVWFDPQRCDDEGFAAKAEAAFADIK